MSARRVYRAPVEKRARLRAAAARHVAAHGLAGFNLRRLAAEAGLGFTWRGGTTGRTRR